MSNFIKDNWNDPVLSCVFAGVILAAIVGAAMLIKMLAENII